ncbi:MAG: FAD-binding protein, partial [Bacteroidia bacterium]
MMNPLLLDQLILICGQEHVYFDNDTLRNNAHDETEDLSFLPEVVVQPATADEVSRIASFCNENAIPLTTRGGGTGLSGGALPINGGVCLNMKRFNRIIS